MTARRPRALLMIGAALTTLLVGTPATAEGAPYAEYVALGDSWTADVVIAGTAGSITTEYVPLGCAQATFNYPKRVAETLGIPEFFDASCGGATTEHFTEPQNVGLGTNPPQFSHLTPTTDLVTIGIGGNDAGLAGAVIGCFDITGGYLPVLPDPLGGSCQKEWTKDGVDLMSQRIKATRPKLVGAVEQVREVSPEADILLVNYLDGIHEPGCYPLQPASNADQVWIAERLRELNAMVADAAAATGAGLVDTYTPSIGHDACAAPTVRYVEGFLPLSLNQPAIAVPFHPNSAGAAAQADAVLATITGQVPATP